MARVLALVPDLLFGSRVQAMLAGAGDEVALVAGAGAVREKLKGADVLVVDLTDASLKGAELVASLNEAGELAGIRTLAFYSHVDVEARRAAEQAGFDLVVARSRMAREGADLVARLFAGDAS
jgi:hypothetical protein